MARLPARLRDLHLTDGAIVAAVREYRPTRADFVDLGLHAALEELQFTTVPQAFARSVLTLVRQSKISRERALDLLQGTFRRRGPARAPPP